MLTSLFKPVKQDSKPPTLNSMNRLNATAKAFGNNFAGRQSDRAANHLINDGFRTLPESVESGWLCKIQISLWPQSAK